MLINVVFTRVCEAYNRAWHQNNSGKGCFFEKRYRILEPKEAIG